LKSMVGLPLLRQQYQVVFLLWTPGLVCRNSEEVLPTLSGPYCDALEVVGRFGCTARVLLQTE